MVDPRATLDELAAALDAAGVGVYLYEGARGAQRWLAGAAHFAESIGDAGARARLAESSKPGDLIEGPGCRDVRESLVRVMDGPEGGPRFYGVLRAEADGLGGKLTHSDGRAGLQSHLTHLAETLTSDTPVAVCVVGIDGLREFNRAYGYDSGDALSLGVGARIARAMPNGAAMARIGGAKFAIALVGPDALALQDWAERLCADIREAPFDVGFGPITVTISIGAALARPGALSSPEPFDGALAALDEARGEGEEGLFVADPHAEEPLLSPKAMRAGAQAVMRALEADRVAIAYQPVVSAATPSRISFRECLARVQDEQGRWVPAGLFLPKIERLDLVRSLDRRVLRLALDTLAEHPTERLSVNVSTRTMRDRAWIRDLEARAAETPDVADRLIVEMTESAAVVDAERTKAFLDSLREMGVAIALDDFGAGYSSFRHVRDFRPDWVKIDGGFVRGVAENPDNRLFVDTLVGIARNFDMATVAEFVETEADADALRELGVDALQGYRYGRPDLEPDWIAAELAAVAER
jgi:diguanylate cyclase (GGDEF)-like protein